METALLRSRFRQDICATFAIPPSEIPPPQTAYEIAAELIPYLEHLAAQEQPSLANVVDELLQTGVNERMLAIENLQGWEALTPREQQVAALACLGYTNQEMAERMVISANTVRNHIRNVLHKFYINSKVELQKELAGWDFHVWVTSQDLRPDATTPPISASPRGTRP